MKGCVANRLVSIRSSASFKTLLAATQYTITIILQLISNLSRVKLNIAWFENRQTLPSLEIRNQQTELVMEEPQLVIGAGGRYKTPFEVFLNRIYSFIFRLGLP